MDVYVIRRDLYTRKNSSIWYTNYIYFFHSHKTSHFGQWHGLQSLTLNSCFYKIIYQKVVYIQIYSYGFIFSNSITKSYL